MTTCPFETTKITCIACGEKLYNVDGLETRTSDRNLLASLGLLAKTKMLIFGGRCDECGGQIGYVPDEVVK